MCVDTCNPELLETLSLEKVDVMSRDCCLSKTPNDFCSLAFRASNVPRILKRGKNLLSEHTHNSFCVEEALAYYAEAQTELRGVWCWASTRKALLPYKTYSLAAPTSVLDASHPKRADAYSTVVQATVCNTWRLVLVSLLAIMTNVLRLLISHTLQDGTSKYDKEAELLESEIRRLVDDICASVPYFMASDNIESILHRYPHRPGEFITIEHNPRLVSSMASMLMPIYRASMIEVVPISQRQWLQHYMLLLTRNPIEEAQKAWKLELTNGKLTLNEIACDLFDLA